MRSHGFDNWPNDFLGARCIERHDSYWVQGQNAGETDDPTHPENLAYHTWHPALDVMEDGTVCDFGHEHGTNPRAAGDASFELSGGWPAFGYAAAKAAFSAPGGQRHEDHVGHKITVATFRAAIGNGANVNDTLHDAGFECTWLSKIHQGSYSLDAFANHLHEYYLTLICNDGGPSVDNTTVGTAFSVKLLYAYGEPGKFVEDNCSEDVPWTDENDTIFDASILIGPEGQSVPYPDRLNPVGNDKPNNRGFTCASAVLWKQLDTEVDWVDIWTELVKIEREDGSTALTIQPYYVVKNPARILEPYDGIDKDDPEEEDQDYELPRNIVRTISLCYNDDGSLAGYPYCEGAPATEPGWRSPWSPFNGTFRAVHFKSSAMYNADGPDRFCTDAFARAVVDPLPCEPGNIEQRVASFTNYWNSGNAYSYGGNSGAIAGSIWSRTPQGAYIEADPRPEGGYFGYRIGHELIIDNRDPDDDFDGVPDGATIRGEN